MTSGERWMYAIIGTALVGLFVAEVASHSRAAMNGMLFLVLAFVPLIFVHQFAHAIAARLVGWRIADIVIGFGPEIVRFEVGRTQVRVKVGPFEDYIVPEPRSPVGARWKSAFIYFAGPAAEILVFVAIYSHYGNALFASAGALDRLAAQAISVAVGLNLLLTLIPRPWDNTVNDGDGIVQSIVSGRSSFASLTHRAAIRDAKRCLWLEDPDGARRVLLANAERAYEDLRIAGLLSVCKAMEGDIEGAHDMIQQLREASNVDSQSAELALARAWTDVVAKRVDILTLKDADLAADRMGDTSSKLLCAVVKLELGRDIEAYREAMEAYKIAREREDEGPCVAVLAIASQGVLDYGDAAVGIVQADFPSRFAAAAESLPVGPSLMQRVAALS